MIYRDDEEEEENEEENEEEYIPDNILDLRNNNGDIEYLIHWKNTDEKDSEWINRKALLANYTSFVINYEISHGIQLSSPSRLLRKTIITPRSPRSGISTPKSINSKDGFFGDEYKDEENAAITIQCLYIIFINSVRKNNAKRIFNKLKEEMIKNNEEKLEQLEQLEKENESAKIIQDKYRKYKNRINLNNTLNERIKYD